MPTTKNMNTIMGIVLMIGTLLSTLLVLVGGVLYLQQHGSENVNMEWLKASDYQLGVIEMIYQSFTFSPIGIIELGLVVLIFTQIMRVGLLVWFYMVIRDYWFTLISLFIFLTLIYSFLIRG